MKAITISVVGEASINENQVLVDYTELRELVRSRHQLLDACKAAAKVPLDTQHGANVRELLEKVIKEVEDEA